MVFQNIKHLRSKIFSGYIITFGIEFLIMIIGVVLFKIISIKFSDIGFAEFSINKRNVGFLMPLLLMGMGVSLPKFLPKENKEQQLKIHYSALLIVSTFFLLFLIVFVFISGYLSKLAFGDYFHEKMCVICLVYVYSLMVHTCLFNFFRSKFNFIFSSILQLVNLGILPLAVYFFSQNIFQYFFILSSSIILFLLIVNLSFIPFIKISFNEHMDNMKKLMNYGIQRMPGDVIMGLFFIMPTAIISNYFSIIIGGSIAFCLSLFNIVIAFMSPVNIILLPNASKIVHEKNFTLLKSISFKLLYLSVGMGLVTLIIVYFFGENILILFGIKNHFELKSSLNIVFMGIIGISIFSIIRSIIDAFYEKARMAMLIIISFLFFLIMLAVFKFIDLFTIRNILISFTISINLLGFLTYLSLKKIFKPIIK